LLIFQNNRKDADIMPTLAEKVAVYLSLSYKEQVKRATMIPIGISLKPNKFLPR